MPAGELPDPADYEQIEIPADKPPSDYSYVERRAQLYRMVEEKGHPRAMGKTQADLAELFDVSQRTVSKDLQMVRKYRRSIAGERAIEATDFLAEKVVMEEMDRGNLRSAWKTQREYVEWLFEAGLQDRAAHKLEIQGDPEEAYMEMLRSQADSEELDDVTDDDDEADDDD